MPAPQRSSSLYEMIGGHDAIASLVVRFYERVLEDPVLAPLFMHVPVDRLQRMQIEFFSAALDGPTPYKGRVIAHAHQRLPITRAHFQCFVEHLFETLEGFPLSEQDRYDIIGRINLYAEDVIGAGSDFSD